MLPGTPEPSSERRPSLEVFFRPRNVAVVGATEDPSSVGHSIMENLRLTPFPGRVYPVNPKRENVLGLRCYPRVNEIPEKVDLAVIATPAKTVPAVITQC